MNIYKCNWTNENIGSLRGGRGMKWQKIYIEKYKKEPNENLKKKKSKKKKNN